MRSFEILLLLLGAASMVSASNVGTVASAPPRSAIYLAQGPGSIPPYGPAHHQPGTRPMKGDPQFSPHP